MKSKRVIIVVLNYMDYKDTEECIYSILKQEYDNFHILIVDNDSKNESYKKLKWLFKGNSYITIIKTGKNYGFAKGNNIGINYARDRLGAEYVMLLNNDTILQDTLYIKKMIENDEENIGVIGSKILQADNRIIKKIYSYVTFPGTLIFYLKLFCECNGFYELDHILEYKLLECKGEYILHGSVLLLTPAYFEIYKGLDPRTFLYCEEELLFLRCRKANLKEKLVDDLLIFHKVGRTSQILYDNNKDIFNKYLLSSYKFILLESILNFICKQD